MKKKKSSETFSSKRPLAARTGDIFAFLGQFFLVAGLVVLALLFLSLYEVRFAELGKRAQDLRAAILRSKFMATVRGDPRRQIPGVGQKIEVPEAPKTTTARRPAAPAKPINIAVKAKSKPPANSAVPPKGEHHSEDDRRELETLIPTK